MSVLRQASLMFGEWGESMQVTLVPNHPGFLLALLPPGAFIGLGLLIAGRNWLDSILTERRNRAHKATETPTVEDVGTETPTADEGWKGDGTETPTVTVDESTETPTDEDGWKGDGHLGRQKGW